MATKVRTIEYTSGAYGHYEVQILEKNKYSYGYPAYDVIGSITWQCTIGEERTHDKWYAMRFNVACEPHQHHQLTKMGTMAKKLSDTAISKQPDEVIAILQAEKLFLHCGQYYPDSYIGQNLYRVMKGDTHYTNVVAPNEIVAAKLAKKWHKMEVVVFDHVVSKNQ